MPSTRAAIFEEILPYINSSDWGRVDHFIVFGKAAFDAYVEEGIGEDPPCAEAMRHLLNEAKIGHGRGEFLSRTSLRSPPPDGVPQAMQSLAQEMHKVGVTQEQLAHSLSDPKPRGDHKPSRASDTDDSIDAALAVKLINDLQTARPVAIVFDKIIFNPKSNHLSKPFEEAHLCNLAGLNFATAILCRAVLEESLKSVIDPKGLIKHDSSYKESYITLMLKEAEKLGILTHDRFERGEEIRKAGNDAVHEPLRFKTRDALRSSYLLDAMRMILKDLHQPEETGS